MKRDKIVTLAILLQLAFFPAYSQDIAIIPNGIMEKSETALVKGDYVRIRSGPGLEYRIITKVNKDTVVEILEKDTRFVTIDNNKNYWYKVRVKGTNTEGWMFGAFLGQKETPVPFPQEGFVFLPKQELTFRDLGDISAPPSLITSGDLDGNGIDEIVLINKNERQQSFLLHGYELSGKGFSRVYSTRIRNRSIKEAQVLSHPRLDSPLLAVGTGNFTYLYSFVPERNMLRVLYKLETPKISLGSLEGDALYLIYLRKNRLIDNDGTLTYYVNASRLERTRGRLSLKERYSYENPLPVKKMVNLDINDDGRSEIVCEIGGKGSGGGITVLSFENGNISKLTNTGIYTPKDKQFEYMWGTHLNGKPMLVLYTTNPAVRNEGNTSLGFLFASFHDDTLTTERFYQLNKLLDEKNNSRSVVLYTTADNVSQFALIDYNREKATYSIISPILN